LNVTPWAALSRARSLERRQQARPVGVGELQARQRLARRARRHRQHAPEAAFAHPRHDPLEDEHRRDHERAVRRLPLLGRERQRVVAARGTAGVGDEHVDRPELGLDGVDERVDGAQVRAVEDVARAARRARHERPLGLERVRDRAPDPARRAGDECDPAREPEVHRLTRSRARAR
jgi:hypothetical protein